MEKIPAAFAMQWSIDLDKALRSNCPRRQIEAIEQIGLKLQQWSMEPNINMVVANIFGLMPGEDRTFANTILLRLADAFRYGDSNMRLCILKVFLPEMRNIVEKGRRYDGFLAKKRVPNYVELLKRVKVVFETGDSQAKALALRLFGCWADLAKDNIQIRQLILSSLRSSDSTEVKASLFAAGSFCLLSEDFAYVILDILVDIICKSHMPITVLLAAIRTFTKFQCSYSIATKAYRAGRRLVLSPLVDDFKAEMLLSLSKLALRSPIFVSEQVDLLVSVLSGDNPVLLKDHALKSLHFLYSSSAFVPQVNRDVFDTLFNVVNDNDLPVNLQCRALRTLRKVFTNTQADKAFVDALDLVNHVLIMVDKATYSLSVNIYLALHLLVDIMYSFKQPGRRSISLACTKQFVPCSQSQLDSQDLFSYSEGSFASLACKITILLFDYVTFLAKQTLANSSMKSDDTGLVMPFSMVKKRCKSLLCLVLLLTKLHPTAGLVALDQVRQLVQNMFRADNRYNVEDSCATAQVFAVESCISLFLTHNFNEQLSVLLEIMVCLFRFTSACLDILNVFCSATPVNDTVCRRLKLLVQFLQESKLFNSVPYEIFCVCMHPFIASSLHSNSSESLETPKTGCGKSCSEKVCWATREWQCLEFIKLMLRRRNYWSVYKAGTYACTGGMWFAATLAFRKLIDHLESPTTLCWLKCLLLLAGTESEIKLLLYPKQSNILINGLQTDSKMEKPFESFVGNMDEHVQTIIAICSSADKFSRAHSRMCAAERTLTSADHFANIFYFQKWFLGNRAKLLEIIVHLIELLKLYLSTMENTFIAEENGEPNNVEVRRTISSLMDGFRNNALKLNKLAKSYDLLATSFMGIDNRNFSTIAAMAMNCSLLSFCLTFAIFFPHSPVYSNIMASCVDLSRLSSVAILEDIIRRIKGTNDNIFIKLQELMAVSCDNVGMGSIHLGTRTTMYGEVESTSLFSKFAILSIFEIQENAKGLKDEADLYSLFLKSFQVISEILRRWMEVPFHVPKYFFKVRPSIGAELFVFNADSGHKNDLQVSPGIQLSLNVCVQLKNMLPKQGLRILKLFCILAASPLEPLISTEPRICGSQVGLVDEMVELNNLIVMFINRNSGRTGCKFLNGGDLVTSYFCCEPNGLGQGFSTCLLDVSAFPVGSYRIKWQSCCLVQDYSYWSLLPLNDGGVFTVLKS